MSHYSEQTNNKPSNTNSTMPWHRHILGDTIIKKKYLHQDETTPEQFFDRISYCFSSPKLRSDIKQAMIDGDFMPAGRALYGLGSKGKFKATTSNCYILPQPEDNLEDIGKVDTELMRICSYGGGAGLNISKLRPKGAKVQNAATTSSGAVSFIEKFNTSATVVGANGRRAALMIAMDVTHPDIEDFIRIKQDNTSIQAANLSIAFTDEFVSKAGRQMYSKNPEATDTFEKFTQSFHCDATGETITKEVNPYELFKTFAESNYDYAEPGALFIDTINEHCLTTTYDDHMIYNSNPCGEYMGCEYNSCNLGSINLYNFVVDPFTKNAVIDYDRLGEAVKLGVEALDEILDYGYDMQPLDANRKCIDDWRAIGLGVYGFADALIALGMEYGSTDSIYLSRDLSSFMFRNALDKSCELGRLKGSFGKHDPIKTREGFRSIDVTMHDNTIAERYDNFKHLRNASLLSIAPTGSIALMMNMSTGIEPLYQLRYDRTTHALSGKDERFTIVAKSVSDLLEYHGIDINKVTDEEIFERFPFVTTTHRINPFDRVYVQSAWQEFVDNAISSTVNVRENITVDEVIDLYYTAWQDGCKGLTIFRDKCKRDAILGSHRVDAKEDSKDNSAANVSEFKFDFIEPIKSSSLGDIDGKRIVAKTSCVDKMFINVYRNDANDIVEVFAGSSGKGCTSNIDTICHLTSLALRSGIKVDEIVDKLRKSTCSACKFRIMNGEKMARSCGAAIGQAIQEVYNRYHDPKFKNLEQENNILIGTLATKTDPPKNVNLEASEHIYTTSDQSSKMEQCPNCGLFTFIPEGRCGTCTECLFNRCD